ncbi:MAG: hypothetical protein R3356_00125 [Eudoraea sp.]|nr:hypothetical protein [Eudoraea sp.]
MLRYIVTEHLEGRGDLIKGYAIATDVFGKDEDFDPDQNSLVRIHAGRLRRQLRMYYLDAGKDDPIIIEIPKGRYIPVISRKGSDADKTNAGAKDKRPKLAVFPFQNLSKNPEFDYLATGLYLELSETLSRYDDFSIIGINPATGDQKTFEEFVETAKDNGVSFAIEGKLQEFDDLLLVRTRVIDLTDNTQIGVDKFKFDRHKNNLFSDLEKLTTKIANYIAAEYGYINIHRQRKLGGAKAVSSLEQDLMLRFYHAAYVLKEEVAMAFYNAVFQALEQEPDSAIINCFAGDIYGRIYTLDLTGSEQALKKFEYYQEKAYSLDPTNHRVLCSLAMKLFVFDEKERFMQILEKYKGIFPKSPLKLGALALVACLFNQWKVGLALLDEVFENNINVPEYFHGLRSCYFYKQRDYERALAEARKYQMPGVYWAPFYRAICHAQLGNISEAKKEIRDLLAIRPDFETRGRYLLGIMIKDKALLEHMVEGLQKADLRLA